MIAEVKRQPRSNRRTPPLDKYTSRIQPFHGCRALHFLILSVSRRGNQMSAAQPLDLLIPGTILRISASSAQLRALRRLRGGGNPSLKPRGGQMSAARPLDRLAEALHHRIHGEGGMSLLGEEGQ